MQGGKHLVYGCKDMQEGLLLTCGKSATSLQTVIVHGEFTFVHHLMYQVYRFFLFLQLSSGEGARDKSCQQRVNTVRIKVPQGAVKVHIPSPTTLATTLKGSKHIVNWDDT